MVGSLEQAVAGMGATADTPGRQRFGEKQDDVARLGQPVVALGTDRALPPAANGVIRHANRHGDVGLDHAVRLQGADDLGRFHSPFQDVTHGCPPPTSASESTFVCTFRFYEGAAVADKCHP